GFRLVDSKINFKTSINLKTLNFAYLPNLKLGYDIRWSKRTDLFKIKEICSKLFSENPMFSTRYKHQDYFSPEVCERYYHAWIENSFADPDSFICVCEHE